MHIDYDELLDATQDDCPVPTVKTKELLDKMPVGAVLKLVSSKEGTVRNIRTFVRNNPYELLREIKGAESFYFYIRKL
ncbi:MAG: SirA family protein [Gallionellales bacterium RIFCSPLOWO2_02_58_13]|nr:MAG: SirA family protein [Gallionellales bacterium RIFCSPLOWO2_02_58_13]HCI14132.1 sulfurtransferase TusA family protein [Gallionellaceae bacterium]